MATKNQQELYDYKYTEEKGRLLKLRPDAWTTSRYDDTARLLRHGGCGGKLLEIGCGQGEMILALAEQFDELVGFDLSKVRIATAQKMMQEHHPELIGKVEFRVGDADQRLPFNNGTFDQVIMCAVLEHVVDVFGLMDEVARVCKVNGYLVMTVPNICYIKHAIGMLFGRMPITGASTRDIMYWRNNGWDGAHLHYFSKAMLDALLRNIGFMPEEWTGDGKLAKLRRWYINLVGNLTVRAKRAQEIK